MDRKNDDTTQKPAARTRPRLGILKVMQSILAGALGVQSNKRHQEDFESASPWTYIVCGLLFATAFIGGLIVLVNIVLAST